MQPQQAYPIPHPDLSPHTKSPSSHSNDPALNPLTIQLEEMKRELERLKGEVGQQRRGSEGGVSGGSGGSTVGSVMGGKKKEEKIKPGRRGGGYGKQAVPKEVLKTSAKVGKGVGDDLVRGFFKRSAQRA
jgi:hypothetical protein